jgi:hypothetical protein
MLEPIYRKPKARWQTIVKYFGIEKVRDWDNREDAINALSKFQKKACEMELEYHAELLFFDSQGGSSVEFCRKPGSWVSGSA